MTRKQKKKTDLQLWCYESYVVVAEPSHGRSGAIQCGWHDMQNSLNHQESSSIVSWNHDLAVPYEFVPLHSFS